MQYKTKIILNFLLRKMSFENDLDNEKIYKINERYKHTNTTGNFWISNQALINQYKPVNLGIVIKNRLKFIINFKSNFYNKKGLSRL